MAKQLERMTIPELEAYVNDYAGKAASAKAEMLRAQAFISRLVSLEKVGKLAKGLSPEELELLQEVAPVGVEPDEAVGELGATS